MTLAQMTDAQKSRWIAEKLEPLDSIPAGAWHADATALFAWTPLRMFKIKDVHDWNNYRQSAEPHDMIHDPAMTLMLMEKLIQQSRNGAEVAFERVLDQIDSREWYSAEGEQAQRDAQAKLLKLAVADAWMLANGWTEDATS